MVAGRAAARQLLDVTGYEAAVNGRALPDMDLVGDAGCGDAAPSFGRIGACLVRIWFSFCVTARR